MKWNNMSVIHKIASVIAGLAAVVWVIFQIKPNLLPVDVSSLCIAVFTLCEGVVCWKEKRTWAILLIVAAVICAASFALECTL
jgi:hypothetical protein